MEVKETLMIRGLTMSGQTFCWLFYLIARVTQPEFRFDTCDDIAKPIIGLTALLID
jgi:hypothetical protein